MTLAQPSSYVNLKALPEGFFLFIRLAAIESSSRNAFVKGDLTISPYYESEFIIGFPPMENGRPEAFPIPPPAPQCSPAQDKMVPLSHFLFSCSLFHKSLDYLCYAGELLDCAVQRVKTPERFPLFPVSIYLLLTNNKYSVILQLVVNDYFILICRAKKERRFKTAI